MHCYITTGIIISQETETCATEKRGFLIDFVQKMRGGQKWWVMSFVMDGKKAEYFGLLPKTNISAKKISFPTHFGGFGYLVFQQNVKNFQGKQTLAIKMFV